MELCRRGLDHYRVSPIRAENADAGGQRAGNGALCRLKLKKIVLARTTRKRIGIVMVGPRI